MIPDAALPVLAEALYIVGDEIGMNADDDARFVARHLKAAGWAIVPAGYEPSEPLRETAADAKGAA